MKQLLKVKFPGGHVEHVESLEVVIGDSRYQLVPAPGAEEALRVRANGQLFSLASPGSDSAVLVVSDITKEKGSGPE